MCKQDLFVKFIWVTVLVFIALPAYGDTAALQKTISANESYLRRFRAEESELSQRSPTPEIDEKLTKLRKKIEMLETENGRLKGSTKNVPAREKPVVPKPMYPPLPKFQTQPTEAVRSEIPAPATIVSRHEPVDATPLGYIGSDWLRMTDAQRADFIAEQNFILTQKGISVSMPPGFYIQALDEVVIEKPWLRIKKLDNLYFAQVYRNEPQSRPGIQAYRWEAILDHA